MEKKIAQTNKNKVRNDNCEAKTPSNKRGCCNNKAKTK